MVGEAWALEASRLGPVSNPRRQRAPKNMICVTVVLGLIVGTATNEKLQNVPWVGVVSKH